MQNQSRSPFGAMAGLPTLGLGPQPQAADAAAGQAQAQAQGQAQGQAQAGGAGGGTEDPAFLASVQQSLEAGAADPEVVRLERRINEMTGSGQAGPELMAVKRQLFDRYYPAMVERGAKLSAEQYARDVFFEVYNVRLLALAEELGLTHAPQALLAHLLLSGVYEQRGEYTQAEQHLVRIRELLQSGRVNLHGLGPAVTRQITAALESVVTRL